MGVLRYANFKNAETCNYNQHIDKSKQFAEYLHSLTLLTQVIEKYKKPMSIKVGIHCGFQTL